MLNEIIVDILVRRIMSGGINPKTGNAMVLADIIIQEYKDEVQARLDLQ